MKMGWYRYEYNFGIKQPVLIVQPETIKLNSESVLTFKVQNGYITVLLTLAETN